MNMIRVDYPVEFAKLMERRFPKQVEISVGQLHHLSDAELIEVERIALEKANADE